MLGLTEESDEVIVLSYEAKNFASGVKNNDYGSMPSHA
jgi:hypothetical protein